jgi:hypothetical protein
VGHNPDPLNTRSYECLAKTTLRHDSCAVGTIVVTVTLDETNS